MAQIQFVAQLVYIVEHRKGSIAETVEKHCTERKMHILFFHSPPSLPPTNLYMFSKYAFASYYTFVSFPGICHGAMHRLVCSIPYPNRHIESENRQRDTHLLKRNVMLVLNYLFAQQ